MALQTAASSNVETAVLWHWETDLSRAAQETVKRLYQPSHNKGNVQVIN